MVEHSTNTINEQLSNADFWGKGDLVIVDRYVSIVNGGSDTLSTETTSLADLTTTKK